MAISYKLPTDVSTEFRHHNVNRYGEAHPLHAHTNKLGGVYTNHLAVFGNQGAAAVAGIDLGVGLEQMTN